MTNDDGSAGTNRDDPWQVLGAPIGFQGVNCAVTFQQCKGPRGREFVVARRDGPLYMEDMEIIARAERGDPRRNNLVPYIWDLRDHDFSDYDMDRVRAAANALVVVPERDGIKRAIVVSDAYGFAIQRMFQGAAEGREVLRDDMCLVTYDIHKAIDWLEV